MFNIHKSHTGPTTAKPATGRLYSFAAPLLLFADAAVATAEKQTEGTALFGNKWVALAVILVGVALFTALVAAVGRYLALTHPDSLNNTTK
jgi:hypothetical protein